MPTRIPYLLLLTFLGASALALPARSDVSDAEETGFTVRAVVEVAAPPKTVWSKLVDEPDRWWESSHTFSGDARNLFLDAEPGGCFCEKLPGDGWARHLDVVMVKPAEELRLTGGLGPLHALAVQGKLTYVLTPADGGTRVELVYAVGGYVPSGLKGWAAPVDRVLSSQLERLKRYVETGRPEPASDEP